MKTLAPDSLLIREKHLPDVTGFSRATIRRLMAAGQFPQCLRIGRRGVAWLRADVVAWAQTLAAEQGGAK